MFGKLPKAHVIIVFDVSRSMAYPRELDRLVADVLHAALQMNSDNSIPVFAFADNVVRGPNLDRGNIMSTLMKYRKTGGRTRYTLFLEAVQNLVASQRSDMPFVVIVISDGGPNPRDEPRRAQAIIEAAEQPIFWLFVGYAAGTRKKFPYLEKLAKLRNVGHFRLTPGTNVKKEIARACAVLG